MDLRQLSLFVAVAEELNFTRAARRMHISQPPLSRQIARLEETLGIHLLKRTRHAVELTNAGRAFLPEARQILALANRAPLIAQQAEDGIAGTLRIGFVHSMIYTSLPDLVGKFRRLYPKIDIKLYQLSGEQQHKMLTSGDLDVALVRRPIVDANINNRSLFREPHIAVLPANHALTGHSRVEVRELSHEGFVSFSGEGRSASHDELLQICHEAGFEPRIVMEASPLSTVVGLVAAGVGVAIVTRSMSRLRLQNVVFRRLTGTTVHS